MPARISRPPTFPSPRPRIKRIDKHLSAMFDPGAAGDVVRLDGRSWRAVVLEALDVVSDPRSRPSKVKQAVDELLRLADIADRITQEIFGS